MWWNDLMKRPKKKNNSAKNCVKQLMDKCCGILKFLVLLKLNELNSIITVHKCIPCGRNGLLNESENGHSLWVIRTGKLHALLFYRQNNKSKSWMVIEPNWLFNNIQSVAVCFCVWICVRVCVRAGNKDRESVSNLDKRRT